MNEFVYVEFLFDMPDAQLGSIELRKLGSDFELLDTKEELGDNYNYFNKQIYRGKISSETATLIKLGNPLLAKHMHISYISEDLKNKYRTDK